MSARPCLFDKHPNVKRWSTCFVPSSKKLIRKGDIVKWFDQYGIVHFMHKSSSAKMVSVRCSKLVQFSELPVACRVIISAQVGHQYLYEIDDLSFDAPIGDVVLAKGLDRQVSPLRISEGLLVERTTSTDNFELLASVLYKDLVHQLHRSSLLGVAQHHISHKVKRLWKRGFVPYGAYFHELANDDELQLQPAQAQGQDQAQGNKLCSFCKCHSVKFHEACSSCLTKIRLLYDVYSSLAHPDDDDADDVAHAHAVKDAMHKFLQSCPGAVRACLH